MIKNLILILFLVLSGLYTNAQITNNSACDVEVTLYCNDDVGCATGCSVVYCVAGSGGSVLWPANCSIPCLGYNLATVCAVQSPCNSTTICTIGGSDSNPACATVSHNNCNGAPSTANFTPTLPCTCTNTLNLNFVSATQLNIN